MSLAFALSPLVLALLLPAVRQDAAPSARIVAEHDASAAYRSLSIEDVDFQPERMLAAPDGSILFAGPCTLEERPGFGLLALDAGGEPRTDFGKEIDGERSGLAFAPLPAGYELVELVDVAVQAADRAGRENVVFLGTARPQAGRETCVALARLALRDGRPKKLDGEITRLIGFGEDLTGYSRARSLAVHAEHITVVGDFDQNPAFLRLDGASGALVEGFGGGGDAGRVWRPVQEFATATYEFETGLEACAVSPRGELFASGRLVSGNREEKAYLILMLTDADGNKDTGFGLPATVGEGRAGVTTIFYQLPESDALVRDLSLDALVPAAWPEDGDESVFIGLGRFLSDEGQGLCALDRIRLERREGGIDGKHEWRIETEIFAVTPFGEEPDELLEAVALLRQQDDQMLVLVRDGEGRVLAAQHDVLDRFYPDNVLDWMPLIGQHEREDLLHGFEDTAGESRVLATLQVVDDVEYLIVARLAHGWPIVLRRFDTASGELDAAW